jgi:GNAT superfamily N-acetyltransferase
MEVVIRGARPEDGPAIREIERLAGARFRHVGLDHIADAEPMSVETLAAYARAGRSWIALIPGERPAGYVLVDIVDANAHIEQISVRLDRQGMGIARALIDHVCAWAHSTGRPAVTLTTFRAVPWNAPLYEHLGFTTVPLTETGPELRAVREAETRHGLDPDLRICMRRTLPV